MLHNEGLKLAVQAYEKSYNQKMVASNYSVSIYTIYRLMKRYKETGNYASSIAKSESKLNTALEKLLEEYRNS